VQLSDVALGEGGFVLDGEAWLDYSGSSVSGGGDINDDGLADVVVGASEASVNDLSGVGRAYVVFGRASTEAISLAEVGLTMDGFALYGEGWNHRFGDSVSAEGDVNGDGLADVIVGAPLADPNEVYRAGRTYVMFGRAGSDKMALSDLALGIGGFVLDGAAESDAAGNSVSGAGDVNGDGLDDIVVGSNGADENGYGPGRTYVVFGKTNTAPVLPADLADGIGGFVVDGEVVEDFAFHSASGAGDINGDGLADVIVHAMHFDQYQVQSSRTYVVFGKTDTFAVSLADVAIGTGGFAVDGEGEGDRFGFSVDGAGDVNGDGLADVVVGAPRATPNGVDSGRAYVVFGKTDTSNVSLANVSQGLGGFAMDGETESDRFGFSVSRAGDLNGDGLDDIIVGAIYADTNGLRANGRIYVVFGKQDTDPVMLADVAEGIGGFVLDGEAEHYSSGTSVSAAGDINGDGIADVVVGAKWASPNAEYCGRTYVVFGGDFSCEGG
jgi:hypothetical protein